MGTIISCGHPLLIFSPTADLLDDPGYSSSVQS